MIDTVVAQGPAALSQALTAYPATLTYHSHIQSAIDREPNAITRSQLRQVVSTALVRTQMAQNRAMGSAHQPPANPPEAGSSSSTRHNTFPAPAHGGNDIAPRRTSTHTFAGHSSSHAPPAPSTYSSAAHASGSRSNSSRQVAPAAGSSSGAGNTLASVGPSNSVFQQQQSSQPQSYTQQPQLHSQAQAPTNTAAANLPLGGTAQLATTAAATGTGTVPTQPPPHHHPHIAPQADATNPARIFKLQFDARRIICCSQTSTIVGWDFCNGDPELEEASRFFGTVE